MELGLLVIFIIFVIVIIFLVGWMGIVMEEIVVVLGFNLGGLLNVIFGNVIELIIGIIVLNVGLVRVVKVSIIGFIIGNLLLVMGFLMFLGGFCFKE